jgi:hypothetical protein
MSIITCSKNNTYPDFEYYCNFSNIIDVINPVDWVIYKWDNLDNNNNNNNNNNPNISYPLYTICIEHICAYTSGCLYGLSQFNIISSSDDIKFDISEDKTICKITTDKYKYEFKKSELRDIKNNIGGIYRTNNFDNISVCKINDMSLNRTDKYYLELDDNILNVYVDNNYCWSKIISKKYTNGIYFMCKDKVFCVIKNGSGILNIFNIDGTLYKNIGTSMEYIKYAWIDEDEDDNNNKFIRLSGFVWQPISVRQYIDVETVLFDRIKQKTYWQGDGYDKHDFGDDDFHYDDLQYDEE